MPVLVELRRNPITPRMREVEQRFGGVAIADLIVSRLRTYGSIRAAARSLDIDHETFRQWMLRFDVQVVKRPSERRPA